MRKTIAGIQYVSGCSYDEAVEIHDRQEREHRANLEIMCGRATKIACRAIAERDEYTYSIMKEALGDMLRIPYE